MVRGPIWGLKIAEKFKHSIFVDVKENNQNTTLCCLNGKHSTVLSSVGVIFSIRQLISCVFWTLISAKYM